MEFTIRWNFLRNGEMHQRFMDIDAIDAIDAIILFLRELRNDSESLVTEFIADMIRYDDNENLVDDNGVTSEDIEFLSSIQKIVDYSEVEDGKLTIRDFTEAIEDEILDELDKDDFVTLNDALRFMKIVFKIAGIYRYDDDECIAQVKYIHIK